VSYDLSGIQDGALDGRFVRVIEEKKKQVDLIIQSSEESFRRNIEANVTYHRFMLEVAVDQRQPRSTAHHQVMLEVYESILRNMRIAANDQVQ
jgi:hypothetical protein